MALTATEVVGEQIETPPSATRNLRKWGTHSGARRPKKKLWWDRWDRVHSMQVVEPCQSRTSTPTPLREALGSGLSGQDVGGLFQSVVEENEKLRRELEELVKFERLLRVCWGELLLAVNWELEDKWCMLRTPSGDLRWVACKLKGVLDRLLLVLNYLDKEFE